MKKFLTKPFVISVLLLLVVWLAYTEYRAWDKNKIIAEHIKNLETQAQTIENKNFNLEAQLKEVGTYSWQEKTARTELGLKKAGESVYVIQTAENQAGQSVAATTHSQWYDNIIKWWEYLFVRNNEKAI